ncbi:MAG: branched-chain amino acid ABC transporter permease [Candidatus Bathyarchaeota archaeon]|nr:branched-chain amino acid ABC transporter permease [Candidatus Bathyarchaeota archaeon]
MNLKMVAAYFRRAYSSFATYVFDVPARLMAFLLFLLLLTYPITRPRLPLLFILTSANIMAIFAASWDLLVGRSGQISLGHALFFGIGAYGTGMLTEYFGLSLWVTIPLSMLAGVLVALVIGYPCLRVKGPYLALVTMAFPLILTGVIFYFKDITGGESGIYGLPRFFPDLRMYDLQLAEYYLTLILVSVSGIILYKIANSKTGIVLVSILDDELASKASGINVTKYKLLAFAISGLFATMAGSINVHLLQSGAANMSSLTVTLSFMAVIVTIFGGLGTIYGPIAAAYILTILDRYILQTMVEVPTEWHMLIFILFIIVLIIKWPRGIARFVTDRLEDLQEERELEERGKHIWKRYKKKEKSSPTQRE